MLKMIKYIADEVKKDLESGDNVNAAVGIMLLGAIVITLPVTLPLYLVGKLTYITLIAVLDKTAK